MIDFNECIAKGFLRRIPPSREKALQSILKAKDLLEEAEANLEEEKYPEIKTEQIESLEKYKSERTLTQYDVSYTPNEEQAEKMIKFAKKFIQTIEEII